MRSHALLHILSLLFLLSLAAPFVHMAPSQSGDNDGDGMEDSWEMTYGLDTSSNDSQSDGDGDGVINIDEFTAGTDPTLWDSDGDWRSDFVAVYSYTAYVPNSSTTTFYHGETYPDANREEWMLLPANWIYAGLTSGDSSIGDWQYVEFDGQTGAPAYFYSWSWYPDGSGDPGTYAYFDGSVSGSHTENFSDGRVGNWSWGEDWFSQDIAAADGVSYSALYVSENGDGSYTYMAWKTNPDSSGSYRNIEYDSSGNAVVAEVSLYGPDGSSVTTLTTYPPDGSGNPYYDYITSWFPNGGGDPGTYYYYDIDGDGITDYDEDNVYFTDKYTPNIFDPEYPEEFAGQPEGYYTRTNADGSVEEWWWAPEYLDYLLTETDGSYISSNISYNADGTRLVDGTITFDDGSWESLSTLYAEDGSRYYEYTSSQYADGSGDPGTYNYFDSDSDGLTDYDEDFLTFTNKHSRDTDGDGMSDYWEYLYGFDPNNQNPPLFDTDGDGLSDLAESMFGFDPHNGDSNGDGIGDFDAIYGADASAEVVNQDTDGDGIPDRDELAAGLDPNDAADATLDTDGDGRSNLQEYQDGTEINEVDSAPAGGPPTDQFDIYYRQAIGEGFTYGGCDSSELHFSLTTYLGQTTGGSGGLLEVLDPEQAFDLLREEVIGQFAGAKGQLPANATVEESWNVLLDGENFPEHRASFSADEIGEVFVDLTETEVMVRLDEPAPEGGETITKRFLMRVDNASGVVQEKTRIRELDFVIAAGETDSAVVTLPPFDLELGEWATFEELDLGFDLVEVDDEGEETGLVNVIKPSIPTPLVNIEGTPSYSNITEGADGEILTDISFDATITSKALDTIAGDSGKIGPENVFMTLNGEEVGTEQASLSLVETKGSVDTKAPGRYPYRGDLAVFATQVEVTEGVNVVEIRATNPIYGTVGIGRLSFTVKVDEFDEEGESSGITWSGLVGEIPEDAITPEVEGSTTVTFTVDGFDTVIQLDETAADSNIFEREEDDISITFATDENGESWATLDAPDYGLHDAVFRAQNYNGTWYFGGGAGYVFASEEGEGGSGGCDCSDPEPTASKRVTAQDSVLPIGYSSERNVHFYVMKFQGHEALSALLISQEEFHGVLISMGALEDFEGENFWIKWMYGGFYIEDPNRPGQPLTFAVKVPGSATLPEGFETRFASQDPGFGLGNAARFSAGFIVGVGGGGYDWVVGTGKLIWGGVKYATRGAVLWYASIRIAFNTWVQGDLEEATELIARYQPIANEQQEVMDQVSGVANGMMAIAGGIIEYGDAYLVALLSGDPQVAEEAGLEVDGTNRMIAEVAAMLLLEVKEQWENADSFEKGKIAGRIFFEVSSIFVGSGAIAQMAKSGKMIKASDVFGELASNGRLADGQGDLGPELLEAAARRKALHEGTGMCFVAGTLVDARVNGERSSLPIEQLEPLALSGKTVEVWSRDEVTKEEDWKRVLAYFTTHPQELFHIGIDIDADGEQDEVISGTGEHPFFVSSREIPAFVPARELAVGDVLSLSDGKPAWISRIEQERAPPGEVFTTYNFEVADFHTYFVGERGVWVHNQGAPCERIFRVFFQKAKNLGGTSNLKAERFNVLMETKVALTADKAIPDASWAQSAREVSATMLDDVAAGKIDVDDLPTFNDWDQGFFKANRANSGRKVAKVDLESHHVIPRKVSELLKDKGALPSEFNPNSVPGHAYTKEIHRELHEGADGMNAMLKSADFQSLPADEMAETVVDYYRDNGFESMAAVAEAWFSNKGVF